MKTTDILYHIQQFTKENAREPALIVIHPHHYADIIQNMQTLTGAFLAHANNGHTQRSIRFFGIQTVRSTDIPKGQPLVT